MPNRLAAESSPYLLQHKDNPVDWYPWGDEALARARAEDKPLLVSIGYSACHWCHVMEHESFEDAETAAVMNAHYVSVKVDREERPDIDSLFMGAVQAMTGQGGWPLNVFLLPDGTPFYGGTYWPPEDRQGMPAFRRVLEAVADTFATQRGDIEAQGEQVRAALRNASAAQLRPGQIEQRLVDEAVELLGQQLDGRNGGFGGAPKFPQASVIEFLLRAHRQTGSASALRMATFTLDRMAVGGLYDVVGGGFHRYTVDAIWLVPHFEKMLYDNGQLARIYLDAFRLTHEPRYRAVVEETLDYVLREMTSPEGGFYSTQDADSEGVEGKFYVWEPAEVDEILEAQNGPAVRAYLGIEPGGNFEGESIPTRRRPAAEVAVEQGLTEETLLGMADEALPKLRAVRDQRVWPGRDEKVITAWNGMTLRAFAEASRTLGRDDYRDAAVRNAEFLLTRLSDGGDLLHTYKDGTARIPGFLDDYAQTIDGLIALYEATLDLRWMRESARLAERMVALFSDEDGVGLFDTSTAHETLIARPRDIQDGATASGTAVATSVLLRLARYLERPEWETRATAILESVNQAMANQPIGYGRHLANAVAHLSPAREVAVAAPDGAAAVAAFSAVVYDRFEPDALIGVASEEAAELIPWLAGRPMRDGRPAAYLCERHTCLPPVETPDALRELLASGIGVVWREM